jgi:hypothetical protein
MMQDEIQDRLLFENWALNNKFDPYHQNKNGEYIGGATALARMGWVASRDLMENLKQNNITAEDKEKFFTNAVFEALGLTIEDSPTTFLKKVNELRSSVAALSEVARALSSKEGVSDEWLNDLARKAAAALALPGSPF